ncbi:hypothetical protein H6P81_009649 [Aristolochia fimbriata]|uniref:Replication factor C subunit 3 n=1 Tax=Aristolochia fimbriata TaxID=158543 RepID=A0AAV7EM45_ARIFI|nr:hypothetical protein H6P81_009649 [Aristolochia fimbriata]
MAISSFRHTAQFRSFLKQRRSGYEPSDTETEWEEETPSREFNQENRPKRGDLLPVRSKTPNRARNVSPPRGRQRLPSDYDFSVSNKNSDTNPETRKSRNRSPYKPQAEEDVGFTPARRNTGPYAESRDRRHVSPYKSAMKESDEDINETNLSNRKFGHRPPLKFIDSETNGANGGSTPYSRKAVSAPRLRPNYEQQSSSASAHRLGQRSPSPLVGGLTQKQKEMFRPKTPSGELNEMVANSRLQANGGFHAHVLLTQSTDSIAPGDIFFSRDHTAIPKKFGANELGGEPTVVNGIKNVVPAQASGFRAGSENKARHFASVPLTSNTSLSANGSISQQGSDKTGHENGKNMSYVSGKSSGSFKRFTANIQRKHTEAWFPCVRAPCRTPKSPERSPRLDETSFIEKAFVVENLRQFWADKHRPGSLNSFVCHKQQAQQLKQLIAHNNCPHILFKGPAGSGRKALCMALLREIYGSSAWKVTNEFKYLKVQEANLIDVVFPLASSPHHMELNLRTEIKNAKYALMALVKEIASSHESTPEVSEASFKADYKVIVLYEVDNLPENIQHLIKWIMDCYTDACKIILCCEDDTNLLESVKGRCKLIAVDAPVAHEIMEVLIQISRKENFELPMNFAAKIATKSKQNLRKAIMALEACKAHNYPFADEQPIPLGWEELVMELASEILADPSPKRLFNAREKLQKLLVDFVHSKLILQKLVEQFLKGVDPGLKRQLYYWHAYYDKRLPPGTSALLKLEEFLAKFASIHRRSEGFRRYS